MSDECIEQARKNLEAAVVNATTRLVELDAMPIDERVRMSYTDAGQTYGWNEYRAALIEQIRSTKELIESLQSIKPWTLHSLAR